MSKRLPVSHGVPPITLRRAIRLLMLPSPYHRYCPCCSSAQISALRTEVSGAGVEGLSTRVLLLTPAVSSILRAVPKYCPKAAWEYTEMKNTAHISVVIALGLASFVALSGLHAAPAQGDKNTERKDQIRRPQHCGGVEPAGGKTAVPVRHTGRDLRCVGQRRPAAPRCRAAPDRRSASCTLHL